MRLLTVSAPGRTELDEAARLLGGALADRTELSIEDVAASLGRRPQWPYRLAVVAASVPEAATILLEGQESRILRGIAPAAPKAVALLYPGVGEHCPGMVAGLYRHVPVFRAALDRGFHLASAESLLPLVTESPSEPALAHPGRIDLAALLGRAERAPQLDDPRTSQLILFLVEYALTEVLRHVGVQPTALLGYSIGEYTAAAVAGILPLAKMAELVAERAALIETTLPGGMLVVFLSPSECARLLPSDVVISAVDGPRLCVVSGPRTSVDGLERTLAEHAVAARRLPVRHGFHSPLLAGIEKPLCELVGSYPLTPPSVPILSNVTGEWLTAGQATSGAYWAGHASHPVRFADNLDVLWRDLSPVTIEAGPGRMLGSLAMGHPGRPADVTVPSVLPTPAHPGSDVVALLTAIGHAWTQGVAVDLAAVNALICQD